LGRTIARIFALDDSLIEPGSLAEYLTKDPRPRQRTLRLSNAKWTAYAAGYGLAAPLGIEEGLATLRQISGRDL
jgi:hypothetical protein